MARGYAQRPEYDFTETYAPVVRMDTLCVILTLVPLKALKLQQIDVKGTYLNRVLKEKIYMRQSEGCGDRTDNVC